MKLTKVGEKRLRAVRAHILEEPRRLAMAIFRLDREDSPDYVSSWPACGTVGCIAGWLDMTCPTPTRTPYFTIEKRAEQLLFGGPSLARVSLFFVPSWPADLRVAYARAYRHPARLAEITASAIDRWIAGGGSFAEEAP